MKKDITSEELVQYQEALKAGEVLKPFSICSHLADHTTRLLKAKKLRAATTCLNNMAKAHSDTSSAAIRAAIENVFLYRIGNFIFSSGERPRYMELLPRTLREALMRQMVPFGI